MPAASKPRRDLYAEVTQRIIEALDQGIVPWKRPWVATELPHMNPVTKTRYRGINPLLLEMTAHAAGYTNPQWLTFKQARDAGGCVRKGERGTTVVFFKMLEREDKDTGEKRRLPILRAYTVFNADQIDGVEHKLIEPERPPGLAERVADADWTVDAYCSEHSIKRMTGPQASYNAAVDLVQMPRREAFVSTGAYYSVLFHELVHSTGHASRLARPDLLDTSGFGSAAYAREELTAEVGAAMLTATFDLLDGEQLDQSASYIASWRKALSDDPKLIVVAAQRAQKAVDLIESAVLPVPVDDEATQAVAA